MFGILTQYDGSCHKKLLQKKETVTKWLLQLTLYHTVKILVLWRHLQPKELFKKICLSNQESCWAKAPPAF